jgi:hypothetical protein
VYACFGTLNNSFFLPLGRLYIQPAVQQNPAFIARDPNNNPVTLQMRPREQVEAQLSRQVAQSGFYPSRAQENAARVSFGVDAHPNTRSSKRNQQRT